MAHSGGRVLVTGAAGFIGSNLVDRLLRLECDVVGVDNISTGFREFLADALRNPRFTFIEGDLLDGDVAGRAVKGCEFVYHMAANADVRLGTAQPKRDLEQNTIVTFNVLEAMRGHGVTRIAFASTGSIYGEPDVHPTPEDAPFPIQTSLYGASKLACEALISAYCEGFGFQGWIFRFVSVLGERYTHGHVFDFFRSLTRDPNRLHVLGNGKQRKSYMYVHDCIDAMLLATERANGKVNILNLGVDGFIEVDDSVRTICKHLGVDPAVTHAGGERGWVGDSPFIYLDVTRIKGLGWSPKVAILDGVVRTVDWLRANQWVYERRQ
jgi:UDP-glucose 4-epimerase